MDEVQSLLNVRALPLAPRVRYFLGVLRLLVAMMREPCIPVVLVPQTGFAEFSRV